jgi:hypothetical protein
MDCKPPGEFQEADEQRIGLRALDLYFWDYPDTLKPGP